jgi:hypothetical protein
MQASSDANSTGTTSAMPGFNAPANAITEGSMQGTLLETFDPLLSGNSNFDNNTEIPQAVTGLGLQVPVGSYSGGGTALLPNLFSMTDKPVSLSTEQSANTFTTNVPSVTGNSAKTLLPNLLSAVDSLSTEQSVNAFTTNVPTVTGNSDTTLLPNLLSATDSLSTKQSANAFTENVPTVTGNSDTADTALLPNSLSAMYKPVSSSTEQSTNTFTANVPTVTGNGDTTLLPNLLSATHSLSTEQSVNAFTTNVTGNSDTTSTLLPNFLSATDKPVNSSTEQSTNAFVPNAPTVTGNSKMGGGVGGKKPTKMRPGNTLTPR